MTQANKHVTRTHYKPGERRKEMKSKQKQEDFKTVNNTESFPQLGMGNPNKNTVIKQSKSDNRQHNKEGNNYKGKEVEELDEKPLRKMESTPVNSLPEKIDNKAVPKSDNKTPPPMAPKPPNFSQNSPLQMPPPMHPGMAPNMAGMMPVNFNNQNMQMPMMGQMIMMMPPNMQMPPPFMMQQPMNSQNMGAPPQAPPDTAKMNSSNSPQRPKVVPNGSEK